MARATSDNQNKKNRIMILVGRTGPGQKCRGHFELAVHRSCEVGHFQSRRMKRSYYETDRAIPSNLFDLFPQKRQQLLAIQSQEKKIQHLIANYKRKKLFQNCQEKILNKILRVYIRHQFVPSSSSSSEGGLEKVDDRSYFLLTVEGRLLDLNYNDDKFPFGLFFDSIRIQIDKRYVASSSDSMIYEWRRDQFLPGKKANCFQFKIYCDKPVPIKIYLTRSDYASKRYELGIALRDLLPSLRTDPTEDEVLSAVWQYIELHSLYDFSSTRALIRCDEVRFSIFFH
jgi:hypothetical protein